MSFNTLGLAPEILRAVAESGYSKATAIQNQAIPIILEGRDIMAGSQTGTGKTAAFTLPLLQRLSQHPPHKYAQNERQRRCIRALILTPTRELAAQIQESVRNYSKHLHLKSTVIFGGVNISQQIKRLQHGVDILVATPGRLLDHVHQGTINLSKVEIFVLDEADRMLDMGFLPDVRKIMALLPKQRQNLLFFATFSEEVKKLAHSLLKSPALIEVAPRNTAATSVTQVIHPVDRSRKRDLLSFLIRSHNWKQVLVFMRTKHGANRLAQQLEHDGLSTVAIHGNKSQAARTRALESFKKGMVRILVATDIASRGLDIDQLPHVVNFELPEEPETMYIALVVLVAPAKLARQFLWYAWMNIDYLKKLNNCSKPVFHELLFLVMNPIRPSTPSQLREGVVLKAGKEATHDQNTNIINLVKF